MLPRHIKGIYILPSMAILSCILRGIALRKRTEPALQIRTYAMASH